MSPVFAPGWAGFPFRFVGKARWWSWQVGVERNLAGKFAGRGSCWEGGVWGRTCEKGIW